MQRVESTTAWARGAALDDTLEAIAALTGAREVEVSVGARPVADPRGTLEAHAHRFTYLAHHTVALLPHGVLRPETHTPQEVLPLLASMGFTRYTIHAPTRTRCRTEQEFLSWAFSWFEHAADLGIQMRLETMYLPRSPLDHAVRHGYHLDSHAATMRFADAARERGWITPLLVDLSHLLIGLTHGDWTEQQVRSVVASGLADHFHVSSNDGTRDSHLPVPHGHIVHEWDALIPSSAIVVDEARRATDSRPLPPDRRTLRAPKPRP